MKKDCTESSADDAATDAADGVQAEAGKSVTILLPAPVVFNITCLGFHMWAEDFLTAAKSYAPSARKVSFAAHFLCCQSIELSLKGFLSLKGMRRKQLRQKPFGHNLVKLYAEGSDQGIGALVTLKPEDGPFLVGVNKWYDTAGGKKFQYFDAWEALHAFKDAPDLEGIEGLATRLQSAALRKAVLNG